MVTVSYHAGVNELQDDERLAALMGAHARSVPFERARWFALLARHCGLDPLVAVAAEGDQRAVLPLCRAPGAGGTHLRALANWYSFSHRPLRGPGAGREALVGAIAADLRRRAARVTLAPLPGENDIAAAAARAFAQAGWRVRLEQCDTNHVLVPAGRSFAEYLAQRPGHLRTALARKGARISTEIMTSFDPAAWAAYEAVYAESWKPAEGSPAFLRAFAQEEGEAGRLRLGLARAQGRVVAAQFWTVEGGAAYIHKLAHSESARGLSPGTALTAALLEHVIDIDRAGLIDFGTGDDPYKRDWMELERPRFRLDCLNPSAPRAWPLLARRALARLVRSALAH